MKYIAFYKPYGVLSQFTDREGRPTLKNYISIPRIYPAGRLDLRSEGLLLLTDDRVLQHYITDPKFKHPKKYYVQVEGEIVEAAVNKLQDEIVLPGVQTRKVFAKRIPQPEIPDRNPKVRDYHPTSWLEIVLFEGKKHQIRKMTAVIGYPTLRLIRISIGTINLNNLMPGEWRKITNLEIRKLMYMETRH